MSERLEPRAYRPASDVRRAGTTLRLRYCWPSELNLMARLADLQLRERYQDWDPDPFTGESPDHISVYEVTAAPGG
jgi:hypothetical protein